MVGRVSCRVRDVGVGAPIIGAVSSDPAQPKISLANRALKPGMLRRTDDGVVSATEGTRRIPCDRTLRADSNMMMVKASLK
jgi:hypothetical protein